MTPLDLKQMDLSTLERIYRESPCEAPPRGVLRGTHLAWLEHRWARSRAVRLALSTSFAWPPFGLDFDRCHWWFWHPRVALGRFSAAPGPSRWRDTDTLRLTYDRSRLPGPVRGVLYDEVKPVAPDLCLGIGGVNGPAGTGDLFFFALSPR